MKHSNTTLLYRLNMKALLLPQRQGQFEICPSTYSGVLVWSYLSLYHPDFTDVLSRLREVRSLVQGHTACEEA